MWKCPRCEVEIDHLEYSVDTSGREYGSADLSSDNQEDTSDIVVDHSYCDSGDSNWEGSCEYQCSECGEDVDPGDLIWINEEDDEDEEEDEEIVIPQEPEETGFKIITPEYDIIKREEPKDSSNSTIICKECKRPFCCDEDSYGGERFSECPNCGTSNTVKEYKELLLKDFFILIKKPNETKNAKRRSVPTMGKSSRKVHSKTPRHKWKK